MRRQITQAEQRALINTAREMVPDIGIRTTMLVGYPRETEEDFEILCNFVRDMKFERLGVFLYSHEEDTRAHDVEDNVPADVKANRSNRLMEIQQEISFNKNSEKVGKIFKVLIDRKEGGYFVGRTEYDSPEVDNEVLIEAKDNYLRQGDFVMIKITDCEDYDLYGELVEV
jgi:ribosomal protein S12 methylthiotransferase